MKVYLKVYPRPLGVEPKLYFEKPVVIPVEVEVEPGYFLTDPYSDPYIQEFETELDARRWIKENYPMSYKELGEF